MSFAGVANTFHGSDPERIFMKRFTLPSWMWFCLSSSIWAESALVHAPVYDPGQKIQTSVETNVKQTLVIAGMSLETGTNNFISMEETVQSASSEAVSLTGKIVSMQFELQLPGGQSAGFDSGNPNAEIPAGPVGEIVIFLKLMSAAPWSVTYNSKGEIVSIEYAQEFLNQVPEGFKDQVSTENRQKSQTIMLNRLPGKAVKMGDKWERNEETDLGSGQKFYMVREYTYLGSMEHGGKMLEKVSFETKSIQFDIQAGGALPVQVKDSNLKVESGTGTYWYDSSLKQIVETDDKMQVVGKLMLVANGMDLPSELDLTIHSITKTNR